DPDNKGYHDILIGAASQSADRSLRATAVNLIVPAVNGHNLNAGRATQALISGLNDPYTRVHNIQALGAIGIEAKDAIPVLTQLKTSPDKATREAATEALKKIQ